MRGLSNLPFRPSRMIRRWPSLGSLSKIHVLSSIICSLSVGLLCNTWFGTVPDDRGGHGAEKLLCSNVGLLCAGDELSFWTLRLRGESIGWKNHGVVDSFRGMWKSHKVPFRGMSSWSLLRAFMRARQAPIIGLYVYSAQNLIMSMIHRSCKALCLLETSPDHNGTLLF